MCYQGTGYEAPNVNTHTLRFLLWTKSHRHWRMIEKMIDGFKPMETKKFDVIKRGSGKTPRNTSTSALFNSSRPVIKKRSLDHQTLLNDNTSRAMIGLRMEIEYKPLEKQTKTELMIMIEDAIRRCLGQVYGFWDDCSPYRYDLFKPCEGVILLIHAAWNDKQFGHIFKPEVIKKELANYDRSGEELSKIAHEGDEIYRLLWNLAQVIRKLFSPYLTNDEIAECFDFSGTEIDDCVDLDRVDCIYLPKLWYATCLYGGYGLPFELDGYDVGDKTIINYLKNEKPTDLELELLRDFPWTDEYAEEGKRLVSELEKQSELNKTTRTDEIIIKEPRVRKKRVKKVKSIHNEDNISLEKLNSEKKVKSTHNEDDIALEKLNSEKKYSGVKADESTISAVSALDAILTTMGDALKREKPDATPEEKNIYQTARNIFGAFQIIRNILVHEDEN